jgi:hypothetical protein
LSLAVFATGCPKYKPKVNFNDTNNLAKQINDHFTDKQKQYFAAMISNDNARAMKRRNELIEDALPYIDSAYMDFITDIQAGRDRSNFVADLIDLGASAAIGITNGERPLQILGIALTAFRGGRSSANLNFYKEQTTPILISKMDGNRANVRAIILQREEQGIDRYPIGAAIRDIVDYYNAGTLVRAFTELSKDTATQTQQAEKRVLQLQRVNPEDVVVLTPDVSKSAPMIGKFERGFFRQLDGTDTAAKADAAEKVRLIYLDIAKGDKSAEFKPILDKLRQNPSTAAAMTQLEDPNEAVSKAVPGLTVLDILHGVFAGIDLQKQPELVTDLKEIYENRL